MSMKGFLAKHSENKEMRGRQKKSTQEGGVSYTLLKEEEIATAFMLGLFGGNFYKSEEEMAEVLTKPLFAAAKDERLRLFATKAALYAAEEGMKFMPVLWSVILSTVDLQLFEQTFSRLVRNPKMLHDFMTLCRKSDLRAGLGQGVKRVINQWLYARLNPYWACRYTGKLEDIVRVTRVKDLPEIGPENAKFNTLLKYIFRPAIKKNNKVVGYGPRRLTFDRAIALESVLQNFNNGKVLMEDLDSIRMHRLQLEELKSAFGGLNKQQREIVYQALLPSLAYAATLSNLVGVERAFATQTHKVKKKRPNGQVYMTEEVIRTDIPASIIKIIAEKISDFDAYKRTRMLPFGLLTASVMTQVGRWSEAINQTLRKSGKVALLGSDEQPLNRKVMVGADVSQSMSGSQIGDTSLRAIDISTYFTAMIGSALPDSKIYAVGDTTAEVNLTREDVIEDAAAIQRMVRRVGHGTALHSLLSRYQNEDVVILITDGQQWDDVERAAKAILKPNAIFIEWHVVAHMDRVAVGKNYAYIAGYSDGILKLIRGIIEGKGDMVEAIRQVQL